MGVSLSIDTESTDARTFQPAWIAPRICATQRELPMAGARVTLPRHSQRGLRAGLGIQLYESVADQREGARGVPVVGGRGIRGKVERVGRRLQHDAQSSSVLRAGRR